ncbi:MAG TPA: FAD-dependent oxidoreductase, partial [Candidatus Eisenbacteria bacterium]|nr:FAD-dependent oxidoreductase [Candidatus Eisenbacteria bacterium]
GGETLMADRVVLAAPAAAAADLLAPLDPDLADALRAFPSAPVAVVALAYARSDVRALDGYGFLVPAMERLDTMGTVWESSVFDGRAAAGTVLLRSMLGGARRPQLASLDEHELEARARRELECVLGITAAPLRRWVWRWRPGITQYELGHDARVRAVRERAVAHAGLELAGSSYDGVSFTAAARSGTDAADRLLDAGLASGAGAGALAGARSA